MGNEKISARQLMMLAVVSRLSLTLIYFGSPPVVKHDVWWQAFLASLLAVFVTWLLDHLWRRFPEQTLVEVIHAVFGSVLGRLITFLYLFFWLLLLGLNLRLTGEFFLYAFLPRTPIVVVLAVVAVLAAWAAKAGIEVIARASQAVFLVLITSILLIVLLLVKDIKFANLLPIRLLLTGPIPHLKDMVSVTARTVEFTWVAMLVPFTTPRGGLFRAMATAQITQGVIWVIMNIAIYGVLGQEISRHYFPFFAAARMINIADFLERIDAVILAVWEFGMFLRAAALLWALSLGTAQWLGLRLYRPLVVPLGAIGVTIAVAQAGTFSEIQEYLSSETLTPFMLTFVLGFPMLTWAVAAVRGLPRV